MDLDDTHTYYVIDIDETVKLTQAHKVKGQGHICIYVKFLFRL